MKSKFLPTQYYDARKKYVLFKNDCGVSHVASIGGVYEKYIFDYIKANIEVEGTTIIDIGANFGFHSLEFADLVGDSGRVEAFEPQRLVYYQLCGNIMLNGYDNIHAHNLALGSETGKVLIETPQYYNDSTINIGNAHVNAYTQAGSHEVDLIKLDDLNFNKVSVIKIDVQGFEPFVLDGAVNTIAKHKPHIFIEIEEPQLGIYNFKAADVISRLESMGYTLKKLVEADHIVDYIAVPNEIATKVYPKVSCVMTTFRRFKCVERSIGFFLQQDYPGETELIILNTDKDHPLTLSEGLLDKNIKVINQHLDSVTGEPYTNVGAIRRDAVQYATGDQYICWDDDDIFLPWNIRQCYDAKTRRGLKAWKPNRSFFKTGPTIKLVQNILEASIMLDMEEVRSAGFNLETGSEHLSWYTHLRDTGELDENDSYCIPAYCFNWGDPPGWGGHKQSGAINDPNNFNNHKLQTEDFAKRPLYEQSYNDLIQWYSDYYKFILDNKNEFDQALLTKYIGPYINNSHI